MPKLGDVKIYMHRPLRGDPKEVTIVKKASGWYAHISCDIGETPKVEPMQVLLMSARAIISQLLKVKRLIILAGIVKQKVYWKNSLKHNLVAKKAVTVGPKPCML